jgi:hypothetical protein
MSPRLVYTDQQLLDFSEEHLLYELNILRWLVETIPATKKGFGLSALLESFAIHLRNLIEFLYTSPNDARADDVVAADFYDPLGGWKPGVPSASLSAARERANKEVSHITYKRKAGMAPDKPWPVADLFKEILPIAQGFVAGASGKKLHPCVVTWSKSDPTAMLTLAVSASTSTSNTAVVIINASSSRKTGP